MIRLILFVCVLLQVFSSLSFGVEENWVWVQHDSRMQISCSEYAKDAIEATIELYKENKSCSSKVIPKCHNKRECDGAENFDKPICTKKNTDYLSKYSILSWEERDDGSYPVCYDTEKWRSAESIVNKITQPSNNSIFLSGDRIRFRSSAKEEYLEIKWYLHENGSSSSDLIGRGSEIIQDFTEGRHRIRVKAIASGKPSNWSREDSIYINVQAKPKIRIKKYSGVYTPGDLVSLEAYIVNEPSNYNITWTLDGEVLGTGSTFSTSTLPIGVHHMRVDFEGSFNGRTITDSTSAIIRIVLPPQAIIASPTKEEFLQDELIAFFGQASFDCPWSANGAPVCTSRYEWHSNIDGVFSTQLNFNEGNLSTGEHEITFKHIVDLKEERGEIFGSDIIELTILKPPQANIIFPSKNISVLEGEPVLFKAETEWRDKPIRDSLIRWHSNIDGQIGTGTSIYYDELTPGDHTITVSASPEGYNASDTQTIKVRVERNDENLGLASLCEGQGFAGNPINIQTGNKFESEIDYQSNGMNPLLVQRAYNSKSSKTGVFGKNWSSNLDVKLILDQAKTHIEIVKSDGSSEYFKKEQNQWISDSLGQFTRNTLVNDNGHWIYSVTDGSKWSFNQVGKVIQHKDSQGYTIKYSYPNATAVHMTDDLNRKLIVKLSLGRIQSITTPDNDTYAYGYNNLGLLTNVTYPSITVDGKKKAYSKTYLYENPHYLYALTGIVDENGNRISTWKYDEQGRAYFSGHGTSQAANDPLFDQTQLEFVSLTQTKVTNVFGQKTTHNFAPKNGVLKATSINGKATSNCAATTSAISYYNNGLVKDRKDKNGNIIAYTYHQDSGLLEYMKIFDASRLPANGNYSGLTPDYQEHTTWINALYKPDVITKPGLKIDYDYYNNGLIEKATYTNLASFTEEEGLQTQFADRIYRYHYAYHSNSRIKTQVIDGPRTDLPSNDRTTYHYDGVGRLTKIVNPLGHTEQYGGSKSYTPYEWHLDANQIRTTYTYNKRGWLTDTVREKGARRFHQTLGYYPNGLLKTKTDPNGATEAYEYNSANVLTAVQNTLAERYEITPALDGGWTKRQFKQANGAVTYATHRIPDDLGRTWKLKGSHGQYTEYKYDGNGNIKRTITKVNQNNNAITDYTYDWKNRVSTVTPVNPGSMASTTSYTYQYDQVKSVTRISLDGQRSVTTGYIHNGFGDLLKEASPDRGTTYYTYDLAAPLATTIVDARGIEKTQTYDALSRLRQVTFPNESENLSYTYDSVANGNYGVGKLTGLMDESGNTAYGYNYLGQMTRHEYEIGNIEYDIGYRYSDAGELKTITYPSGRKLEYSHDTLGRIKKAQENKQGSIQPLADNIQYKPFGPMTDIQYGNGISDEFQYDQSYRLTQNGQWADYRYTLADQLEYAFGAMAHKGGIRYLYNKQNQLGKALWPINPDTLAHNVSSVEISGIDYDYNWFGSLVGRQYEAPDQTTYYVNQNQIDTQDLTRAIIQVTPNTNRINKQIKQDLRNLSQLASAPSISVPHEKITYGYDEAGNINSRYTVFSNLPASGPQRETFKYNQNNRMTHVIHDGISAEHYQYNGAGQKVLRANEQGNTHLHYNLSGQLIAETNDVGQLIKEYAYLGSQPLALFDNSVRIEHPLWRDANGVPLEGQDLDNIDASDGSEAYYQASLNGDGALEIMIKLNGRSVKPGQTSIGFELADGNTTVLTLSMAGQTRRVPLPIYDEKIVLPLKQNKRIEFGSTQLHTVQTRHTPWIKLIRQNNTFTLYGSFDGRTWEHIDELDATAVPYQLNLKATTENAYFDLTRFTAIEVAEPTFYYHNDHLGSPKIMTNADGQTVWKADLAPYGETFEQEFTAGNLNIVGTLTDMESSLRFPGQYANPLTGLHYNYFRDYDPSLGGYIQSDPIGLQGGLNTYGYAGANPIVFVDPKGLRMAVCLKDGGCYGGGGYYGGSGGIGGGRGSGVNAGGAALYCLINSSACVPELNNHYNEDADGPYCPVDLPDKIPEYDFNDPASSPVDSDGNEWTWKGKAPQGGDKGGYKNPNGPESMHPDLGHEPPIGPHWDFNDRKSGGYRIGPDGTITPK